MNKAKVIWFNKQKGFGYCTEEKSGEEIFIHYSAIISNEKHKSLQDGQVIYLEEICTRNNKLCADKIHLLKPKKKDQSKPTKTNSNYLSRQIN